MLPHTHGTRKTSVNGRASKSEDKNKSATSRGVANAGDKSRSVTNGATNGATDGEKKSKVPKIFQVRYF